MHEHLQWNFSISVFTLATISSNLGVGISCISSAGNLCVALNSLRRANSPIPINI